MRLLLLCVSIYFINIPMILAHEIHNMDGFACIRQSLTGQEFLGFEPTVDYCDYSSCDGLLTVQSPQFSGEVNARRTWSGSMYIYTGSDNKVIVQGEGNGVTGKRIISPVEITFQESECRSF